MTTKVPLSMIAVDVASQAELDAEAAARSAGEVGDTIQFVTTQTGAVATGTTVIPVDDTIPQNTEGNEYLTLGITPTASANKLRIEAVVHLAASVAGALSVGLFQDAAASALAAAVQHVDAADQVRIVTLIHCMTAGTESVTNFKIRAGLSTAGTTTFNGAAAARLFGGILVSSLSITEIKV